MSEGLTIGTVEFVRARATAYREIYARHMATALDGERMYASDGRRQFSLQLFPPLSLRECDAMDAAEPMETLRVDFPINPRTGKEAIANQIRWNENLVAMTKYEMEHDPEWTP